MAMFSNGIGWGMAENGNRQWVSDANLVKLLVVIVVGIVGQIYLNINSTTAQTAHDVGEIRSELAAIHPEIDDLKSGQIDLMRRMATVEQGTITNTAKGAELEKRLDNQKYNKAETGTRHAKAALKAEKIARKRDADHYAKTISALEKHDGLADP
jgi:hypothetical protein